MLLSGSSLYASFKGVIEIYSRYLAKELGERKIWINAKTPGAIATNLVGSKVRGNKAYNNIIPGLTSLGCAGLPDNIGKMCTFPCTDDAYYINGQRIEVSEGQNV